MVDLFNENTLFVFFFAMVAIYNYSALKEYQRMAIIYISVYALAALDIISIKLGLLFLIVALFCFFEIFTTDEMKFKILVNPIYKILDFVYSKLPVILLLTSQVLSKCQEKNIEKLLYT